MTLDERLADLLQRVNEYVAAEAAAPDDELAPSLLVIAVQPRAAAPTSTARLAGNPHYVGRVLAMMLADERNIHFLNALLEEMDAVDKQMVRTVLPIGKLTTD